MGVQLNTCVARGCFVRNKLNKIKLQNGHYSGKCYLDHEHLASSCPCCHKQYNLTVS